MWKILTVAFFSFFVPLVAFPQILPKEGSRLNYRLVGFSFPNVQNTSKTKLEIAVGDLTSVDSFEKNRIKTYDVKDCKAIIELPFFGKSYTWRVIGKGHKVLSTDKNYGLHHFSTTLIPAVDTSQTRLRVLKQAVARKDAYVLLDGNRAMYDMGGNPIWYLPDIDGFKTDKSLLRDLKTSPQGNITFLYEERGAYEINLNGDILWKAPNNGTVNGQGAEFYHHEFTRLSNGNYMILGSEYNTWNQQMPSTTDSGYLLTHDDKKKRVADSTKARLPSIPIGTIMEYNGNGDVVWSWRSSSYFRNSDIYYHTAKSGKPEVAVHENSFYFDEKDSFIYIGYRNISRILKLKYPENTVVASYGESYKLGEKDKGNGLYCRQHSVRKSGDGYLYLFDNNCCIGGEAMPRVQKYQETSNDITGLKKIWEYEGTIEGIVRDTNVKYNFQTGGNVLELKDKSLFINMSTIYSKVFILDTNKNILWGAIPERWNTIDKKWEMVYQYRASIIENRGQLEQMVWAAEAKL